MIIGFTKEQKCIFFLLKYLVFKSFYNFFYTGLKILKEVLFIKEQNKGILEALNNRGTGTLRKLPEDIPVDLPLRTETDLSMLETYLENKTKLNELVSISRKLCKMHA